MLARADLDSGVLTVTLDRPEKRNALSHALADEMAALFTRHRDDATIRLAVLTGAGDKAFASGGDLGELAAVRSLDEATAMSLHFRSALDSIRSFPVPVIAAINGDALGGGAELAMACDLRIAASHARLGFLQGKLAISTAWGGGPDLIAAVGGSRALRMLGRAEILSTATAREWGLIDAVADTGQEFGAFVAEYIAAFAQRTPAVMRAFKSLASASRRGADRDELLRTETDHFAQTWIHDDHWAAAEVSLGRAGKA